MTETWYEWKEKVETEEGEIRYLTPRRDPMVDEYAINFAFETTIEAGQFLEDWGIEREEYKDWFLVRMTMELLTVPEGAITVGEPFESVED